MYNEEPVDDEVAARVRAAVAGDFQPKRVNGFPMRPNEGSIDLVSHSYCYDFNSRFFDPSLDLFPPTQGSIDARSSRPPVKQDDIDRDRRRESVEMQKSTKDLEKKKEKKKNLEQQALETLLTLANTT